MKVSRPHRGLDGSADLRDNVAMTCKPLGASRCLSVVSLFLGLSACTSSGGTSSAGTGGAATGGSSQGGSGPGTATGGTAPPGSGGVPALGSGGAASGGRAGGSGGSSSGGTGGVAAGTGGASASGGAAGGTASTGGAAGQTAGSGGGGGGGGGSGFGLGGASLCATAGVALCEDFENGLSTDTWKTTQSGDGTLMVDSVHVARGTHALHVKTTAGNGFAYIKETTSFPAPSNILYGRMFVWFEDDITTDGHFSLAEGAGTGTSALIRFGGQYKEFGVGTDGGSSGDWTDHDTKLIPSKTWICAEFEFKGDTNQFHVWWDDAERTALQTGPSRHAGFTMPEFNSLWFGWWMYNAKEPQELWIDEIAVDYKPIGCTK